jgi:phosphatidylinositol-3-phosphatase
MGDIRRAVPGLRALRFTIVAVVVALSVSTYGLAGATTSRAATTPPPHIMLIVMENEGYSQIIGNTSQAPYINYLATKYRSATSWYGLQHSSLADYVALISGATGTYSLPTVVGELASAGITWKAYMEDMPSICYTGKGIGNYSKLHNPFVYFKSIKNNPAQCGNVVPVATPLTASSSMFDSSNLNSSNPPAFVWVTPNECDDMNSKCSPLNNHIKQGDQWLSTAIPLVQKTSWYTQGNGVIIITWDAATIADTSSWNMTGSGGHVPTIVVSQTATGPFTAGGNHYGTLRGIETAYTAYGVGKLGASAIAANGDLSPAFH